MMLGNRIRFIALICFAILCGSCQPVVKGDDGRSTVPFLRPIPSELNREIVVAVAKIARSSEVTVETQAEMWRYLRIDSLRKMGEPHDRFVRLVRDKGKSIVPILAEALVEKEPVFRRNAVFAVGALGRMKGLQDEDYGLLEEKVLTPLLIRSLNDRDAEVRGRATAYLGVIVFEQTGGVRGSMNPRIIGALATALSNEQDKRNQRTGVDALWSIGRKDLVPAELKYLVDKLEGH